MDEETTITQATEQIARRIAQKRTGTDSMWELFLNEAYKEYYGLPAQADTNQLEKGTE